MADPGAELQTLIYDTLLADAAVAGFVGAEILDTVPDKQPKPYISFGPASVGPDDAAGIVSSEHNRQIDVWSDVGGAALCGEICHAVKTALHDLEVELTVNKLALIEVGGYRILRDPNGVTYHGVVSIRAIVEEGP